jgi:hypothetical protein
MQEGRVWVRTRRKGQQNRDLNTALIFWPFFIKEKRAVQHDLILKTIFLSEKHSAPRHLDAFAMGGES